MYLEVNAAIKEANENENILMLCLTGNGKLKISSLKII
jgi:hypothetical protein